MEVGQLVFIAGLLAFGPMLRRLERLPGIPLAMIGWYALGTLAMHWFLDRVGAFIPGV